MTDAVDTPPDAHNPFIHTQALDHALDILLNSRAHIFITGRAGTGKSTLLRRFLSEANLSHSVVLAPTGVAALNVEGETIHHFFSFPPAITTEDVQKQVRRSPTIKKRMYRALDTMIIDEISMVRADLLDHMDEFLRYVRHSEAPFGGVRLIAFGDLYQLPPVVTPDEKKLFTSYWETPYFFSSKVFTRLGNDSLFDDFALVELDRVFRQQDSAYVDFLNKVRMNALGPADLEFVNSHVVNSADAFSQPDCPLFLTTTRARSASINSSRLDSIDEPDSVFYAETVGDFPLSYQPTEDELHLKIGARIMMVANDVDGEWVNGSLGTVKDIDEEGRHVSVALDSVDGAAPRVVKVSAHSWDMQYNEYNVGTKQIEKKTLGSFRQMPMRLAWAVTIHKSQGKTYDSVIVDLERRAFAHGQAYVALSRTRSFEGLHLARALKISDIRLDRRVSKFMMSMRARIARTSMTFDDIMNALPSLIEKNQEVEIDYLAADGTISTRVIIPLEITTQKYENVEFQGLRAQSSNTDTTNILNVERIIEVRALENSRANE